MGTATYILVVRTPKAAIRDERRDVAERIAVVNELTISEVRIDDAGRLLVVPEEAAADPDYLQYVYRAGRNVRWDREAGALATPKPDE